MLNLFFSASLFLFAGISLAQTYDYASVVESLGLDEAASPIREHPQWQRPIKIAVTIPSTYPSNFKPNYLEDVKAITGDIEIVPMMLNFGERPDPSRIDDVDVFLGYCFPDMLTKMENLRWLQYYGTGLESCLVPEIRESDFILTNVQHTAGPPIAEHAIALLLTLTRGLNTFHVEQEKGNFNRGSLMHVPMVELGGKTMLVVGLGGIGSEIARRAAALDMRVIGTRNSSREGPDYVEYVGLSDELYTLAAQADVVVNALPLTEATRGIFNDAFFNKVKRGAIFISISRGENTVTDDLVTALKDGRVGGAGLDVTDPEPLPADHELGKLPNVVITPHMSFKTDRGIERGWAVTLENLRRYINGDPLYNIVDKQRGY